MLEVSPGSEDVIPAACVHDSSVGDTLKLLVVVQVYQDLCKVHKTFSDRSENVDVSVEVTLQPWHAFKPDGVVLFSDILTPLTGMNIPFDIIAGTGPVISKPIRTLEDVAAVGTLDAEGETPYVGGALEKVSCLAFISFHLTYCPVPTAIRSPTCSSCLLPYRFLHYNVETFPL